MSERVLGASSAAAEPSLLDEGTPGVVPGVSDTGRVFWVTFFARTKKVTRINRCERNVSN